jgi:hypothetical protein
VAKFKDWGTTVANEDTLNSENGRNHSLHNILLSRHLYNSYNTWYYVTENRVLKRTWNYVTENRALKRTFGTG